MLTRIMPFVVLLLVPTLVKPELTTQPSPAQPAMVVRFASLDSIFEHLRLIGGLIGQDNFANELDQAIKSKLGAKGLFGIDKKRPIGFYANIGADISDLNGVLLVPIVGTKQFKEMLEGLGWEVKADNAGQFTVKQNLIPGDLQYRIMGDYAYVGLSGKTAPAPAVLAPQAVFGAAPAAAAITASVRLNQIPEAARAKLLESFKESLGKIDDKAGESKAQKALATGLANEITRMLDSVLKDGEELTAQIDIEPKTKQMIVDLRLSAKAKSKLAENIAKLGQRQTLFAGVLDKNAAMNGLINLEVPAEVRTAWTGIIQEVTDKALADLTDPGMKKQAADLLDALKPSLTAPDLDAAFSMRGPGKNKLFTFVAGFKLVQGEKLAATLLEIVKGLPGNEQKTIELNVDKVSGVPIHRIDLQASLDAKTKEMLGEQPLYIALRDNGLFLAIGEEALPVLKQALAAPATAAAPLLFDMSMARFAAVDKDEAKSKAAQAMLQSSDDARMRLELSGGPTLRLRLTMSLSALRLFN